MSVHIETGPAICMWVRCERCQTIEAGDIAIERAVAHAALSDHEVIVWGEVVDSQTSQERTQALLRDVYRVPAPE